VRPWEESNLFLGGTNKQEECVSRAGERCGSPLDLGENKGRD